MKPLSSVISQLLDPGGGDPSHRPYLKSQDAQIWRVWNRVVGDQIAHRAQPDHLKGSILYVEVKALDWLHPLQEIGPQLLEKLNEAISHKVSRIVFFQRAPGDRGPKAGSQRQRDRLKTEAASPKWHERIPLNPEENQEMDRELSRITDPELRELIKHIRVKAAKLEKLRSGS